MKIQIENSSAAEGTLRHWTGADNGESYRCASYQRGRTRTSIHDQLCNCRDLAARKKWTFLPEFAFSGEGRPGSTLASWEGLDRLLLEATKRPLQFDCVLVDDTARLSRNLAEVLTVVERLQSNGIFVYFVAQGLDSRAPAFRNMLLLRAMIDEDYLVALRNKIHLGMKGK